MSKAKLIFDCPERNADLYYATGFLAPDDVLFLETGGKKYFILSDLEFERGRKEAKVDKVFSITTFAKKVKKKKNRQAADVIAELLKSFRIRKVMVPRNTAFTIVDGLRRLGIKIEAGPHPFYPERTIKTPKELGWMEEAQRAVFQAIGRAEKILREAAVRRGFLYWKEKILTSERMRRELDFFLMARGFHNPMQPIVAGGLQSCDPHNVGSGPLKPHQSIIVDVFPSSDKTRFWGDATRTFCKGKAPEALKKQYAAVKTAQERAIAQIKAGINGRKIYKGVVDYFEKEGYPTKAIDGFKQGFIHGVGHGIGLEIHEEPVRISNVDFTLKAGHAVTVEPGLYYRKVGGVRLEDIVCVTKKGCRPFPTYPKQLEIL